MSGFHIDFRKKRLWVKKTPKNPNQTKKPKKPKLAGLEVTHKDREVSQCTCRTPQPFSVCPCAVLQLRQCSLLVHYYYCFPGTVFTGHDDIVLCFFCGLAIHRWGPEDDPRTAHARWSSSCSHLWAVEQPSFILRILRELENVGAAN